MKNIARHPSLRSSQASGVAVILLSHVVASADEIPQQPNIVIILADDISEKKDLATANSDQAHRLFSEYKTFISERRLK